MVQQLQLVFSNLQRSLQRHFLWWMCGVLAMSYLAVFLVQPVGVQGVVVGSPSPVDVMATRSLTYNSDLRTKELRDRIMSDTTQVAVEDRNKLTRLQVELESLLDTISSVRSQLVILSARRAALDELDNDKDIELIPPEVAQRLAVMSDNDWRGLNVEIKSIYSGILQDQNRRIEIDDVVTIRQNLPNLISASRSAEDRAIIERFITPYIQVTVTYDQAATQRRIEDSLAAVKPVEVQIAQGESIVRNGDVVTPLSYEKMMMLGVIRTETNWLAVTGHIVLAYGLAFLLGLMLRTGDEPTSRSNKKLYTILLLIVVTIVLTRLFAMINPFLVAASPLVLMCMLLTIVVSIRTASLLTINVGIVVLIVANGSLLHGLPPLLIALVAGSMVHQARRSSEFMVAGGIAALTGAVSALSVALVTQSSFDGSATWPVIVAASISGLISALLSLSLYSLVGKLSGITTPFELLELANPEQPILRRLVTEASATYSHSVTVGILAERAAEAIGANSLLLKVAAYYHDIGKIKRPYFFTENQTDGVNLHDTVTPHESARIIIDHVRDGIKMANEVGLPPIITNFIATHHGTSVLNMFYRKALDQDPNTDVADFTYPGPKPTSREQAILMLADGVEATVRSKSGSGALKNDYASVSEGIAAIVDQIFNERIKEEQLADTALTMSEIKQVRQAFIKALEGLYHSRVDYKSGGNARSSEPKVEAQGHI
ncbi:MAG: HD family phosphohydrolase [Roseiflexaceae bacterium]